MQTGFQWYLDIKEAAGNMNNVVNEFSVGGPGIFAMTQNISAADNPRTLYYADDQDISVYDFLYGNGENGHWGLNIAFKHAQRDGLTDILYHAYAIAEPLHEDTLQGTTPLTYASGEYALAVQKGEFAIKYYITPNSIDRAAFKLAHNNQDLMTQIRYHSGLHGSMPSDPPTSLVTDADIPVASVGYSVHPNTNGYITDYSLGHISCIIDHPPVPPDVSFVPFKGVNNRILILLDANVGDYYATPIILDNDDVSTLSNYVVASGTPGNTMTFAMYAAHAANPELSNYPLAEILSYVPQIHYKSDDPIRKYQIFRLESRPTSYLDFYLDVAGEGTGARLIEVEEILAPGKPAVAASYVDALLPNTKYYYCVRGIDVHANFSNPTHVFEIELVDNDGQRFMTQKVIRFETIDKNVYSKPGRRFILIEPALQQMFINPDTFVSNMTAPSIDETDPANLSDSGLDLRNAMGNGIPGEKIWDKIFKIRITSRSTGKKFDINLTFKNRGVVNP